MQKWTQSKSWWFTPPAKDIEAASQILQKDGNFPSIDANDKKEFAQGLEMLVKANDEQLSSLQKKVKDLFDMDSKK